MPARSGRVFLTTFVTRRGGLRRLRREGRVEGVSWQIERHDRPHLDLCGGRRYAIVRGVVVRVSRARHSQQPAVPDGSERRVKEDGRSAMRDEVDDVRFDGLCRVAVQQLDGILLRGDGRVV